MLKSKSLMTLLGVFVVAAVVWALLNLWYVPTLGKFSCSYQPAVLGAGAADAAADECPETVEEAMNAPEWAENRWEELGGTLTQGLYFDQDGERHEIRSGNENGVDAQRAAKILRQQGAAADRSGRYPAATHVEVKVAAMMRVNGETSGLVVINHRGGPCRDDKGLSCQEVLPMVLASGSVLGVWFKDVTGVMTFQKYVGR